MDRDGVFTGKRVSAEEADHLVASGIVSQLGTNRYRKYVLTAKLTVQDFKGIDFQHKDKYTYSDYFSTVAPVVTLKRAIGGRDEPTYRRYHPGLSCEDLAAGRTAPKGGVRLWAVENRLAQAA